MKKRKKRWVIDLGEALTKIVVAAIDNSGMVQIKDIRIEKTPNWIWPEANLEKKPKTRKFLRALLRGYRRQDEVMLLINHKEMMVETFTFPMMTLAEVEEALFWKMQLLTAENLEYWRIDFVARERTQWLEYLGMDNKNLEVLGVAVEKNRVARYTKIFRENGCNLSSIVPHFYPLDILINQDGDRPTLMIDMGKQATRFFYYQGHALTEYHRIELERDWDGVTYLLQIIKTAEQVLLSPSDCAKAAETANIYLMGGESLHPGVHQYLTKWLDKEIKPSYYLLDEKEQLTFPRQISKSELCLITACVCGLIKSAQISGGAYEA